MPIAAPRPCTHPGCGVLVSDGTSRCTAHKSTYRKQSDQARGSSTARGYGSKWQKARKEYLEAHHLCVECQLEGRLKIAEVVDHKVPHKGDQKLFWDRKNWQALCKKHHDRKTAGQDGGFGNNWPVHRVGG